MWHKNAGRENAGLENMAQEIMSWKMRKSQHEKRTDRRFISVAAPGCQSWGDQGGPKVL